MSWNQAPANGGVPGMMQRPPMFQPPMQGGGIGLPNSSEGTGPPHGNMPPLRMPPPMTNPNVPTSGIPLHSMGPPRMNQMGVAPPMNNPPPQGLGVNNGPPQLPRPAGPPPMMNRPGPPLSGNNPPTVGMSLAGPMMAGPPQPGAPDSPQIGGRPPSNNLLNQPASLNTSRVPSPIPSQQFDALEGQFRTGTPNSALGTPPSGSPVPNASPSPRGGGRPLFPPPAGQPQGPPVSFSIGPPNSNAQPPLGAPPSMINAGMRPPSNQFAPPMGAAPPQMGNPPHTGLPPTGLPPQPGQFPSPVANQLPSAQAPPPNVGYGIPPAAPAPQPGAPPGSQNSMYGGMNTQFANMGLQSQHQVPVEMRVFNLLQERNILVSEPIRPPVPNLPEHLKKNNCSPDIFRCTLNAMPQSNSLLQKSRLPLGILIHPFKDLSHLPVIQSSVIVRCRSCRAYINPFVSFIDQRRWRCNLCFRANELPEEFNFDPVSKSYGSPERRPEIKSATIEFVAPSEYMLRPPQPCVYLFVLDVSYHALQSGYLQSFCEVLSEELEKLPGDSRTMIGFITYNSSVHFYNLSEDLSTPQIHVVSDVDDIFLPLPEGLLANLQSSKELVEQLLEKLPTYHQDEFNRDESSAMGAAMQAALKLTAPTGGRISVLQASLPNCGPGKLTNREDPNQRASSKPANLQPATDFYKLLSLEAAGQQIAIDLFLLNQQYADHATIGGAARHSGGAIFSYPALHTIHNPVEVERFEADLKRYFTRKIGLEAVMRVRCTKGLAIHSFHGNFFVRSTDLLSLPNINPDAGFGMQMSIEDNLTDSPYACMQAALLYTSSKGERRIRVHTLCLPVSNSLTEVINSADQQAIIGLLSKMAVDRSINSAVSDAREALVNAVVDALGAYGGTLGSQQRMGALPAPYSLRLLPLYASAMLKHPSIRVGVSTKTDERVDAMDDCKSLPLSRLIQQLTPDLYPVHALNDEGGIDRDDGIVPQPPRLPLSSASMDRHGAFILDVGTYLYMWIGSNIQPQFCNEVFGQPDFQSIQDGLCELPDINNDTSDRLRIFISYLQDSRPSYPPLVVIRDDSRNRQTFIQHMIEDKTESSMSYYEFLQHVQKQIKS